jgi:hypothetical protein
MELSGLKAENTSLNMKKYKKALSRKIIHPPSGSKPLGGL